VKDRLEKDIQVVVKPAEEQSRLGKAQTLHPAPDARTCSSWDTKLWYSNNQDRCDELAVVR